MKIFVWNRKERGLNRVISWSDDWFRKFMLTREEGIKKKLGFNCLTFSFPDGKERTAVRGRRLDGVRVELPEGYECRLLLQKGIGEEGLFDGC